MSFRKLFQIFCTLHEGLAGMVNQVKLGSELNHESKGGMGQALKSASQRSRGRQRPLII